MGLSERAHGLLLGEETVKLLLGQRGRHRGLDGAYTVVIKSAEIEYKKPVTEARVVARSVLPGVAELDAFASREIAVLVVDACPGDAGGTLLMSGSRAGLGADLAAARDQAYAAVDKIKFEDAHVRRDIAAKALRN